MKKVLISISTLAVIALVTPFLANLVIRDIPSDQISLGLPPRERVPDEENSFFVISQLDHPNTSPREIAASDSTLVDRYEDAYRAMIEASALSYYQNPDYLDYDKISVDLPVSEATKRLQRLSALALLGAKQEHTQGNYRDSINIAASQLRHSDTILSSNAVSDVEFFMALTNQTNALDFLAALLNTTFLPEEDVAYLSELINRYPPDRLWLENRANSELALAQNAIEEIVRGILEQSGNTEAVTVSSPIFLPNRTIQGFIKWHRFVKQQSQTACHEITPYKESLLQRLSAVPPIPNYVGNTLQRSMRLPPEMFLHPQCDRELRFAAIKWQLALKQHLIEHGEYPQTLADLSTTLPIDPYSGELPHYDGEAKTLISVGKAGKLTFDHSGERWRDMPNPRFYFGNSDAMP